MLYKKGGLLCAPRIRCGLGLVLLVVGHRLVAFLQTLVRYAFSERWGSGNLRRWRAGFAAIRQARVSAARDACLSQTRAYAIECGCPAGSHSE